jgi:arylsulfatase A-like enzyme
VPVLRGQTTRVRDWLHFEHAPTYSEEQGFHALADGRYKYIWRPKSGREQLFDLAQDPHELVDLASQPGQADLLAPWRQRLTSRLAGRPEGFSDGEKLIPGRPYPRLHPAPKTIRP